MQRVLELMKDYVIGEAHTSAYREKIRICESEIEHMHAEIRSSDRYAN